MNTDKLRYLLNSAKTYLMLSKSMNSDYYRAMAMRSLRQARVIADSINRDRDTTIEFKIKLAA